jgi:hypothetical protein
MQAISDFIVNRDYVARELEQRKKLTNRKVGLADEILVVDSFSTDKTLHHFSKANEQVVLTPKMTNMAISRKDRKAILALHSRKDHKVHISR